MNEDKMAHLKKVTYTERWPNGAEEEKVALFDDRQISGTEVLAFIKAGETYHPNILVMSLEQAVYVLGIEA